MLTNSILGIEIERDLIVTHTSKACCSMECLRPDFYFLSLILPAYWIFKIVVYLCILIVQYIYERH
jgi:hypothetical protein